jgi:hypothetical protein
MKNSLILEMAWLVRSASQSKTARSVRFELLASVNSKLQSTLLRYKVKISWLYEAITT